MSLVSKASSEVTSVMLTLYDHALLIMASDAGVRSQISLRGMILDDPIGEYAAYMLSYSYSQIVACHLSLDQGVLVFAVQRMS